MVRGGGYLSINPVKEVQSCSLCMLRAAHQLRIIQQKNTTYQKCVWILIDRLQAHKRISSVISLIVFFVVLKLLFSISLLVVKDEVA